MVPPEWTVAVRTGRLGAGCTDGPGVPVEDGAPAEDGVDAVPLDGDCLEVESPAADPDGLLVAVDALLSADPEPLVAEHALNVTSNAARATSR